MNLLSPIRRLRTPQVLPPDGEPLVPTDAARAAVKDNNQQQRLRPELGRGLARSVRLFQLFLLEQSDPERFYTSLAEDAVRQVEEYGDLAGRTVVDVGGGAGYFTAAFRARGARSYLFEPDPGEMRGRMDGHGSGEQDGPGAHGGDGNPGILGSAALPGGTALPSGIAIPGGDATLGVPQQGAVVADGYWLPVRDGGADICFSSNVLEHLRDPMGMVDEMVRATRPGGLIYVSFTNWYSPWGGHEMSPWHYLGAGYAERRYVKRHKHLPKNRFGVTLFPLHVGPFLRLMRARSDVEIVDARPRYYPHWCRFLLRIPLLREVAVWNLLLILRRKG